MIDDRFELAPDAGERALLTCFLDWHRDVLLRKCTGLTDEQLRGRAVPTSNLTLLGLLRHMAGVERWYFQAVIAGDFPGSLYTATDDPDEDFNNVDAATGDATIDIWRAEVEASRRIAAEHSLDDTGTHPTRGRRYSLRWVFQHMIDEYARHNGHADLIREAIDGETGE
ncbi:MAG TPA: DinB family protein [Pseudonocardiaceae bacterium]